eukprot:RCo041406
MSFCCRENVSRLFCFAAFAVLLLPAPALFLARGVSEALSLRAAASSSPSSLTLPDRLVLVSLSDGLGAAARGLAGALASRLNRTALSTLPDVRSTTGDTFRDEAQAVALTACQGLAVSPEAYSAAGVGISHPAGWMVVVFLRSATARKMSSDNGTCDAWLGSAVGRALGRYTVVLGQKALRPQGSWTTWTGIDSEGWTTTWGPWSTPFAFSGSAGFGSLVSLTVDPGPEFAGVQVGVFVSLSALLRSAVTSAAQATAVWMDSSVVWSVYGTSGSVVSTSTQSCVAQGSATAVAATVACEAQSPATAPLPLLRRGAGEVGMANVSMEDVELVVWSGCGILRGGGSGYHSIGITPGPDQPSSWTALLCLLAPRSGTASTTTTTTTSSSSVDLLLPLVLVIGVPALVAAVLLFVLQVSVALRLKLSADETEFYSSSASLLTPDGGGRAPLTWTRFTEINRLHRAHDHYFFNSPAAQAERSP